MYNILIGEIEFAVGLGNYCLWKLYSRFIQMHNHFFCIDTYLLSDPCTPFFMALVVFHCATFIICMYVSDPFT